jgi:hypothetical protein
LGTDDDNDDDDGVPGLSFRFGSFGSGPKGEIEVIKGSYLAALEADEDDDSIAAVEGGTASCGSGSRQRAVICIVKVAKAGRGVWVLYSELHELCVLD